MSEDVANNWNDLNQDYLMASLKIVQGQLENYKVKRSGEILKEMPEHLLLTEGEIELEKVSQRFTGLSTLEAVVKLFGLSAFEKSVLLLCAGVELDSNFAYLIAEIQGNETGLPTFSLALSALNGAHWSALSPQAPLRYWRLIELTDRHLVSKSAIKIDEHILHYLAGVHFLDDKLTGIVQPLISPAPVVNSHIVLVEKIMEDIRNNFDLLPVIELTGDNKQDKESIAAGLSQELGLQLFTLCAYVIPSEVKDVFDLARLWSREAALKSSLLYLDFTDIDTNDKTVMRFVNHFISNVRGLIILNSEKVISGFSRRKNIYKVEKPVSLEQAALWTKNIGEKSISGFNLNKLVSQFNLSSKTIAAVSAEINGRNGIMQSDSDALIKKVWKTCCVISRPEVGELAVRIESVATMEDLVLPETQKDILRELIMQVRHRTKVYGEWGFASRGARGLGITALFSGESGTGKTMASEVIANELKLDLYRIDLSQVINKYIGETEKNLKTIFDAAEDGGAILLFDEADALFGKRSEVKDSHDRYANMEVSYLLQRMEAYRGLAILTTNMKNTLDKAWMRRIRFIIQFPFPDLEQRAEIWRRVFPADTPTEMLEIEKLAKLNIAGGNIRNIALNAAFIAANEDSPVNMSHLSRAMRREYIKLEKHLNNIESCI